MTNGWEPGGFWRIDDLTGFKVRASDTRKQWDGAIVHSDVYENRNPQDLIRSRRDKQSVQNPRPEGIDTFIGPLTASFAAAAAAGATSINVDSSVRMLAGDHLVIMLDNGDTFRTTISSVTDASNIVLVNAMPYSAAAGNSIVDNTAMAAPDLP
jgi:hypothetical protein